MNTAIQGIADLDINDKNILSGSFLQLMRDIYELINLSENNPIT